MFLRPGFKIYLMANFEREITHCINRFFTHRQIHGFAYRLNRANSIPSTSMSSWTPSIPATTRPSSASRSRARRSTSPSTSTSIRTTSTRSTQSPTSSGRPAAGGSLPWSSGSVREGEGGVPHALGHGARLLRERPGHLDRRFPALLYPRPFR